MLSPGTPLSLQVDVEVAVGGDRSFEAKLYTVYYTTMTARYVHVEVREMRRGITLAHAEADCAVALATGETMSLVVQLRSDRAPYWRVVSVEAFGNPLLARAVEAIGEEALLSRIATAAALYNVWDAARARDFDLDG